MLTFARAFAVSVAGLISGYSLLAGEHTVDAYVAFGCIFLLVLAVIAGWLDGKG